MMHTKTYDVCYTINADHVTSVYFADLSVNFKQLKIFNTEGHKSLFGFVKI